MPTQQELKQQGNIHFQNNNFEKAIEFYTLAIEKDAFCDEAAPILSNRSLCYYNIGKYKEAYEDAGCCCGIRPDWAKGFARRGAAAEKLGEFDIALESYNEYLKLDKSDEMDIKSKQRNVKKIVGAIEKKEQEREKELERIGETLSAMKDGTDEKRMSVHNVLEEGCAEMYINKIEIALKYGADLTRDSSRLTIPKSEQRANYYSDPKALGARLPEFMQPPKSTSVAAAALIPLHFDEKKLGRLTEFEKTSLLVEHRTYLDRLLDLVNDEYQKDYTPPENMLTELSYLLRGSNENPLRKDIFLILLDKGKKYFMGDDEKTAAKEFRMTLVHRLLAGRAVERPFGYKEPIDADIPLMTGEHLRNFRECVEMGVAGLSAQDIASPHSLGKAHSHIPGAQAEVPVLEETFLETAIKQTRSPEIAECFLKRGADSNQGSSSENQGSILDMTLNKGIFNCSKILLAYGAKLAKKEMPEWIVGHYSDSMSIGTIIPQKNVYPRMEQVLEELIKQNSGEETIRMFFDAITEQNLSLIFYRSVKRGEDGRTNSTRQKQKQKQPGDDEDEDEEERHHYAETPLIFVIRKGARFGFLDALAKARPKLVRTPGLCSFNRKPDDKMDNGIIIIYPLFEILQHLRTMTISEDSFAYVIASFATFATRDDDWLAEETVSVVFKKGDTMNTLITAAEVVDEIFEETKKDKQRNTFVRRVQNVVHGRGMR